jgi:hypothetical protein
LHTQIKTINTCYIDVKIIIQYHLINPELYLGH